MLETLHCPKCPDGELMPREGRLDQSGETYLPTIVWGCTTCGYARYEAAASRDWLPQFPTPPEAAVVNEPPAARIGEPEPEPLAA